MIIEKESDSKFIWALFSIANEYDQPEHNLKAWWAKKPTIEQLAYAVEINFDSERGSPVLGKIMKGEKVRYMYCDFRLEKIQEGKIP